MAITTSLYKGKEEMTMQMYEALPSIDSNIDYTLTNHPDVGITNAQMTFALTCARLFQAGETYTCIDDGTYTAGHTYKIVVNGGVKSWLDITAEPSKVNYLTTAPTADNTDGLKFVVLDAEPATYYNGYYYIITEA